MHLQPLLSVKFWVFVEFVFVYWFGVALHLVGCSFLDVCLFEFGHLELGWNFVLVTCCAVASVRWYYNFVV